MHKLLILGLFAVAMATAKPASDFIQEARGVDCLKNQDTEVLSCILVKTASALDRAAKSNDVQIFDGVTFVRTTPMERNERSMKSELEIMNELPEEDTSRAMKMLNMVYDSAHEFFQTHSLKVDLAESRAMVEAGRKTTKKMILPLLMAAAVKIFALGPILLGGLGLLVLKALFVSKIALLVAAVLGFQRLFGAGGGTIFGKNPILSNGFYEVPTNGGWSGATGSSYGTPQGYYNKRSFEGKSEEDAQKLAYSAHVPSDNEKQ